MTAKPVALLEFCGVLLRSVRRGMSFPKLVDESSVYPMWRCRSRKPAPPEKQKGLRNPPFVPFNA